MWTHRAVRIVLRTQFLPQPVSVSCLSLSLFLCICVKCECTLVSNIHNQEWNVDRFFFILITRQLIYTLSARAYETLIVIVIINRIIDWCSMNRRHLDKAKSIIITILLEIRRFRIVPIKFETLHTLFLIYIYFHFNIRNAIAKFIQDTQSYIFIGILWNLNAGKAVRSPYSDWCHKYIIFVRVHWTSIKCVYTPLWICTHDHLVTMHAVMYTL